MYLIAPPYNIIHPSFLPFLLKQNRAPLLHLFSGLDFEKNKKGSPFSSIVFLGRGNDINVPPKLPVTQ